MLTTEIVKDGEVLTVIVNMVTYKVQGEEDNRIMYVATNLPGSVHVAEIRHSAVIAKQVNNEVREAIFVMNDFFPDFPDVDSPFEVLHTTLVKQPI